MKLTQRQLDVLSDVLESPQEWADHAETSKGGVASVLAKVAKYESAYDEAVAKGNYLNRKQRDDAEEQAEQGRYDNVSYDVKRSREYASIPDQLDYIFHNGVEKWKTDMVLPVKEKYPKGDS